MSKQEITKEYIDTLIEQADILEALVDIEDRNIGIELKSHCKYLVGYIHALKK